jgi:hypothetical protein
VARAVVSAPPPPTAPPPLSLDDAEDVVLEFTAPPRPAVVSRPLPAPEDAGIVEVDFSEFRDVLGVATFKTDAPQPIALQGPVSTPQPVAITLPRTPSMSRTPSAPVGITFGGGAGPGPGPDATPPTVPDDAAATASVAEHWVVTAPGLPGPRLGHGGMNEPLRSPATSSVSTMPAPVPIPMTTTPPPMLTPPTRATAAGPSPAPPAPQELPPISMDEHEVVTTPGGLARGVRRPD